MKYATWTITNGTTPETEIRAKGGQASGAMTLTFNTILGYVSDDADLTGLQEWNVTPQTSAQALTLAKSVSPSTYYSAAGTFVTPVAASVLAWVSTKIGDPDLACMFIPDDKKAE